jgi:hypothetical protein
MNVLVAVEVGVDLPQDGTSSPSGADRQMEPVSAEARRMARLRSDCGLSVLSTDE